MDPISIVIGAIIMLIGLGVGYLLGSLRSHVSASGAPVKPVCSCSHGLGHHDEVHGICHGQILRKNMRDPEGDWIGDQWVQCTCRHYDGPQPIEKYLATPTLPPRDGA